MASTQPTLQPVEFWFEFASTYSYPAAMRIAREAQRRNIEIEWKPFLLGPIFATMNWKDSPFTIYPEKGQYMWRDLERTCQALNLPFKRPSQFPRGSLLAARIAVLHAREAWIPDFVRAVYTANFSEDRDIGSVETITGILEGLGLDAMPIVTRGATAEAKERLRSNTEAAIAKRIFGAPSFVAAGELFWGNDRLEQALDWAAETHRG